MRMLASEARIDMHRLMSGQIGQREYGQITQALESLSEAQLFIDDTAGISVLEMRAKARRLKAEHGLNLLAIDYVQLMTGRGGWPLNCFALPDGRPLYGGTYFPPKQWVSVLHTLSQQWREHPDKALAYADMELPLGSGPDQIMLAPRVQARLVQDLAVQPTDKVLFRDMSFGGEPSWPKNLKRMDREWSCEA